MRRSITLLLCALLLIAPSVAWAQETNAPPGNSGVDEYLESVPSATGDRPTGGSVNGKPRPLTPREREAVKDAGADAQALERAVSATKPDARTRSPANDGDDGGDGGTAAQGGEAADGDRAKGRSPVSAVIRATTGADGDGLGLLLPAILLGALLGALGVVGVRIVRNRPPV